MTTVNGPEDPFWNALVAKYGVGCGGPFDQDIAERRLEVGGADPIDRGVLLDIVREVTGADLGLARVEEDLAVAGPRLLERPVVASARDRSGARPRIGRLTRLSMWIGGVAAAAVLAVAITRPLWDGQDRSQLPWIDAMVLATDPLEPFELRDGAVGRVIDLAIDSITGIRAVAHAGSELEADARMRLAFLREVASGSSDPLSLPDSTELFTEFDAGVGADNLILASETSSRQERLDALQRLTAIASQSIHQLRIAELGEQRLEESRDAGFEWFDKWLR